MSGEKQAALIARYEALTQSPLTREEQEEEVKSAVLNQDWEGALEALRGLTVPLSRQTAAVILPHALHNAPAEVFSALLAGAPPGEYTQEQSYPQSRGVLGQSGWVLKLQGTLVMQAAAEDKPVQLTALLDHGADVNSASPAAAVALMRDFGTNVSSYGDEFIPFHGYTARPESRIWVCRAAAEAEELPAVDISGATPLAAAVALGSRACVPILLERGAWGMESPSVSCAMGLFWRERDPSYCAVGDMLLAGKGKPVLQALSCNCSPGKLHAVLSRFDYSEAECADAALGILNAAPLHSQLWNNQQSCSRDLVQRLNLLGRACPGALRTPEVVDALLLWCSRGRSVEPFLPYWAGQTLDLSAAQGLTWPWMDQAQYLALLKTLAHHCTLVADPDSLYADMPLKKLRPFLQYVTILPPAVDRGVSALSQVILRSGDVRVLRQALETGLIPPEESTEELLACRRMWGEFPACRMALLTARRPQRCGPLPIRPMSRCGRWFQETVEEMGTLLQAPDWERLLPAVVNGRIFPVRGMEVELGGRTWKVLHLFCAACAAGRADIISRWLELAPRMPLQNTDTFFGSGDKVYLTLTPLCAAALGGNTDVVRVLLEHGAAADEQRWGSPSTVQHPQQGTLPLPPVLAALSGGHRETAALLEEHGGTCDLEDPVLQSTLAVLRADAPQKGEHHGYPL